MKKYLILIILLLSLFQTVYAVENTYPELKLLDGTSYIINEDSTFVDYVAYGFMMIISIGAVILLVVVIWAGINFIMAGGDPGKISKAKEMLINGFIGMAILLSVYWVLGTINPGIIEVENPDMDVCSMGGIILTVNEDGKIKKKCINESIEKIDWEIESAEWSFEYGQVKEVWAFDNYNFQGTPTMIFQDGVDGPCHIAKEMEKGTQLFLAGKKSILIIQRLYGFYFYDKEGFGIEKYTPFYVSESVPNINDKYPEFNDKASSFNTVCTVSEVNERPLVDYYNQPNAIIFEDANYFGKCSLILSPRSIRLDTPSTPPDEKYTSYIGNNKMSSVIVYNNNTKIEEGIDKGRIILYNSLACNKGDSDQNSFCEIDIHSHYQDTIDMENKQGEFFEFPTGPRCDEWDGSTYIQSIKIPDGKGAVVVVADDGTCAYFDSSKIDSNNCIKDLRESGIYQEGGRKPKKVIVIPVN